MRKQIFPIIVITVLTGVVWLFAEVESLGEDRPNVRIRFEAVGDPPEVIASPVDFDGNVSLLVRGSRGAIQRARAVLDSTITLKPGDTAIPDVDGVHTIRLKDALDAYQPLADTGIIIETIRPQRVDIRVDELVNVEVAITPELAGIVTEGEVSVSPPRARVRAPRSLVARLDETILIARVDPLTIDSTTPGPRTKAVPLRLPPALDQPGVRLLTDRATVAFSLRSTITTRSFPSVPVQVLLTTDSARAWQITIDPQQQLIPVELRGPSETLLQLAGESSRLVAVLALSDIELSRGVSEKPVRMLVLRDNIPTPLPETVAPIDTLPTVRFTSTRAENEDEE